MKNQAFAIKAAAEAIEKWWESEESSTLLLASKSDFFLKCADVALQAACDANISGRVIEAKTKEGAAYEPNIRKRVIEAKTKDGKPITIRFWSEGDVSHYQSDEWNLLVQVDKELAEKSGDVGAFRLMEDLAALDAKGVDIKTLPLSARHVLHGQKSA
jgi:hypothetical protein